MESYRREHYRTNKRGEKVLIPGKWIKYNRKRNSQPDGKPKKRFYRSAQIRSLKKNFGKEYYKYTLGRFGYKDLKNKTSRQRHIALERAISKFGYKIVVQRLIKICALIEKKKHYMFRELKNKLKNDIKSNPGNYDLVKISKEHAKILDAVSSKYGILKFMKKDVKYIKSIHINQLDTKLSK